MMDNFLQLSAEKYKVYFYTNLVPKGSLFSILFYYSSHLPLNHHYKI